MGRLLYILLSLIIAVGCSEDAAHNDGEPTGEAISFSAGSIARGASKKESWRVGDKVAIFVADSEGGYSGEPYCYEVVDERGAMDATSQAIYDDGLSSSFSAFYPYDSALDSYEEYIARGAIMDSATDYLASGVAAINAGAVLFQFSHIYSMLTFDFFWGYQYDDSDTFTAMLDVAGVEYELDVVDMSASIFVIPQSEIVDAKLTITVTSTATDVVYDSDLSSVSEVTEWVMGDEHKYTNIVIGTADLTYNLVGEEYEIYSAKGLQAFADLVNGYTNSCGATVRDAVESFGVSNPEIDGRLMNNINMSTICGREVGRSWTPIGRGVNYKYEGRFDGNNKLIYALFIEGSAGDNMGLFGYLHGAEISNIGVIEGFVSSTNWYIGGLAAYAGGGTIINCCYYEGEVSGAYTVGGLVGQVNKASIISSYSTATVYASNNYVGGLIGQVASGGAALYGCYSSGAVDCGVSVGDKGGIIGEIGSGALILLNGCYFWYGADESLRSVGDANNTLNVFQRGYSLSELSSVESVDDLNSAVTEGVTTLSTGTKYIFTVGASTPELTLKRE